MQDESNGDSSWDWALLPETGEVWPFGSVSGRGSSISEAGARRVGWLCRLCPRPRASLCGQAFSWGGM